MILIGGAMRIIIIGGPRRGKSTLAATFGYPVFCGDPVSKVKEPRERVTYLPEGLDFAGDTGAAAWIAGEWLIAKRNESWVMEGHVMARALRRWLEPYRGQFDFVDHAKPADKIIVLSSAKVETSRGQDAMHLGVMTVWNEIAHNFIAITEHR